MSTNINKVLLGFLPYWDPLIPPQGIAQLKTYLEKFGYSVKTIDANTERRFKNHYDNYFNILIDNILEYNRGNFYNIGHDVLRAHMMAHINYTNEEEYINLVKIMLYKNYYVNITSETVKALNRELTAFYTDLEDYIVNLIELEKPQAFGLSLYKGTLPASLFAFRVVKRRYPHIKNVMGGGIFAEHYEGTPNYDYLIKEIDGYVDKVLIGQGELLWLKYLEGELPETKKVCDKRDIDNQQLEFQTIDTPDLSDFNINAYPYIAATSSGSCPYQCSFCNVTRYFGKYEEKNLKIAAEDMIKMKNNYNKQIFFMIDSLLNLTIDNLAEEIVKSEVDLYYDGYLRVGPEVEKLENVLAWRRGGFYRARIGAESGSDNVLSLMDKKITVEQTKKTIRNLAYAGIKTTVYIVIGHPGETEDDFQMTLNLLEELKDDIWQAECNPFEYYYTGQTSSEQWAKSRALLYPAEARKMLLIDYWYLNEYPSREETFERVFRFNEHCRKLGIPNPYSLNEVYEADRRWSKLHPNSVPSLVELMSKDGVSENEKEIKRKLFIANKKNKDYGDFVF